MILTFKRRFLGLITKLMYVFLQVGHEKKHKGVIPLKFLNYNAEEDILLYHGSEAGES